MSDAELSFRQVMLIFPGWDVADLSNGLKDMFFCF